MSPATLSFDSLLGELNDTIVELGDPRKPSNATSYSVKDAVLGAFSCFFHAERIVFRVSAAAQ